MQVMCINSDGWRQGYKILFFKLNLPVSGPKYGEFDDVVSEFEEDGVECYELQRWPGYGFNKELFIPIADSDLVSETEERVDTFIEVAEKLLQRR